MDTKNRCQSCGMPLEAGFYGTDIDGNQIADFCSYCYEAGSFTNPYLTQEEMIQSSINHMTGQLGISEPQAQKLAQETIPTLKRWQSENQ